MAPARAAAQFALLARTAFASLPSRRKFSIRRTASPRKNFIGCSRRWTTKSGGRRETHAVAAHGISGVTVPRELGGSEVISSPRGWITGGLARWNPAVALGYAAHENLCVNNIARNASRRYPQAPPPKLRRRRDRRAWTDRARRGLGCAGLDGARPRGATATITCSTAASSTSPTARSPTVLLVYAKTDKAKGPKGISAFVIEKDFPGFKVAQKLDKMGFRGSRPRPSSVFDDCRVPAANCVGDENRRVRS